MLRIRLISSLGAGALAAALGFAAPAGASPTGFGANAGKLLPGSRSASSEFVAGYQSSLSSSTAVSLTTTIVVPAVKKCGTTKKVLIPFVGAQGASDQSAVGLDIHCNHGKVIYFPIFNDDGTDKARASAHAHPGDKVVLRMSWNSTRVSLAVVDETHPSVTRKLTGPGSSSFSDPRIEDSTIDVPPAPVPDFGKVTFSESKINGQALGAAPGLERFNLVNSSHVLQIKTSPIRSNNESFTTTFKHS